MLDATSTFILFALLSTVLPRHFLDRIVAWFVAVCRQSKIETQVARQQNKWLLCKVASYFVHICNSRFGRRFAGAIDTH